MIKLSDLLECVSPPDEQTDLMNLAVATAKRLEALDVPRNPVVTPTPERPHEWVVYRGKCEYDCHWRAITGRGDKYWGASPTHQECLRFATAAEAQNYIDTHKIEDAYPWPVPKLTS